MAGFKVGQKILKINYEDARGFSLSEAGHAMKLSTSVVLQVDGLVEPKRKPTPAPVEKKKTADAIKNLPTPGSLGNKLQGWKRASMRASESKPIESRIPANTGILDRSEGRSIGVVLLDAPTATSGLPLSIVDEGGQADRAGMT